MNKKVILILLLAVKFCVIALAQSAQRMEEIMESSFLSKGEACYLIGISIGLVKDDTSYAEAFDKFTNLKMFKNAKYNEPIRFDEFSNLALQNSSLEKSLWYSITKNPHYAFRQLKMMKLIPQNQIPSSKITPHKAVRLLAKIMPNTHQE